MTGLLLRPALTDPLSSQMPHSRSGPAVVSRRWARKRELGFAQHRWPTRVTIENAHAVMAVVGLLVPLS